MEEKKVSVPVGAEVGLAGKEGEYFSELDFSKVKINLNEMFKNGVHFGHHKSRKNPKMDKYVFGAKNGISIIDLQQTEERLREALYFIQKVVSEGQDILFVGTRKQAKKIVEGAAKRCDMPFVVERWLGGTFTNFGIISQRTRFLREGKEKIAKGEYVKYTKFEQMKIAEELDRLETKMGGIKNMHKTPGAVFVTGVIEDNLAIKEARKKNVPVIAMVDSNVDPSEVDYPIPANDDAVSSIRIILTYVVKVILENAKKPEAEKVKV